MPRDPERRALSREADKVRKRTRRAIERLEKQEAEATNYLVKRQARQQINQLSEDLANLSAKRATKESVNALNNQLAALQARAASAPNKQERAANERKAETVRAKLDEAQGAGGKPFYSSKAMRALELLKTTSKVPATRKLSRKAVDFTAEIRKASKGGMSILGNKPREKVQIFYRVTQNLWNKPGISLAERNAAIMKGLGVNSMEAAWSKVMSRPDVRKLLRKLNTSGGPVADTDDEDAAYREAARSSYKIDTPTDITLLQMIEDTKAYGAAE